MACFQISKARIRQKTRNEQSHWMDPILALNNNTQILNSNKVANGVNLTVPS
ncbi:hypothetical protein VAEU17_300039 [Vibrio aestuarianus]|nr:hypothetical protein VAEU17_300039 [Vibrio aestuarianus]